jgi:uncharacterized RDD family membrane protein YckC
VKCPKCSYLGFESTDRCRNCGYDFSLMTDRTGAANQPTTTASGLPGSGGPWRAVGSTGPSHLPGRKADPLAALPLDTVVVTPEAPPVTAPPPVSSATPQGRPRTPSLPLFQPDDDEPLVKLPAAPRPPLAVRRTPERPRRAPARPARRAADVQAPALPIAVDWAPPQHETPPTTGDAERAVTVDAGSARAAAPHDHPGSLVPCSTARRLAGAGIDHGILLAIDLSVAYFTLRMAGLATGEWWLVPPLPFLSFLLLLKVAYFSAFTMVGGQTIGKMAVGIRVVGDDGSALEPARAVRRTIVGGVAMLAAGAGLVPLLVGGDGRGFHDRVARTRVIAVPSARSLV